VTSSAFLNPTAHTPSRFIEFAISFITVSSSNPVRHPKFVDRLRDGGIVYARHHDGREFPTEASISRSVVNKQPMFTIVLRDVSEREQGLVRMCEQAQYEHDQQQPCGAPLRSSALTRMCPSATIASRTPTIINPCE
jgi:hypothetical protein